jgi:DNA-binding transcriptional MerR regulator/methylmalonyl-CoA mutase cobalamin-binding subunit
MTKLRYPIRAVAKLTGLSLDTLRAWERRYQAVMPERGRRGRLYTEHDLERLQLLREVVNQGHAIGQVARLGDKDLRQFLEPGGYAAEEVASRVQASIGSSDFLGSVVGAIEHFDYAGADLELSRLATLVRPRQLIHEVVLPLMRLVGKQFCSGRFNIAQEHMTSAIMRNLLGALVRTYTIRGATGRLLFATPPGELHEFGILAGAMLAAGGGLGIVYLGPNLPAEDIISAAKRSSSQVVVLGILAANEQVRSSVKQVLRALQGRMELWLAGSHAAEVARGVRSRRLMVVSDFGAFEAHLQRLGAKL